MLNIYAASFLTATRLDTPRFRDAPKPNKPKTKRWLPVGHWWIDKDRDVDIDNL